MVTPLKQSGHETLENVFSQEFKYLKYPEFSNLVLKRVIEFCVHCFTDFITEQLNTLQGEIKLGLATPHHKDVEK